jgi:hypothetical protein
MSAAEDFTLDEPIMVTLRQLDIMAHATGWASRSRLYRNYYCADPGHESWAAIQGLVERGLMMSRSPLPMAESLCFAVTAAGIDLLKRWKP